MPSAYLVRNFVPGAYYHIYNRGAHRQNIFQDSLDYETFTQILSYYLTHPLGTPKSTLSRLSKNKELTLAKSTESTAYTLLSYCLMPNHFHLMIRQDSPIITISNLLKRLGVTYAMYYNQRHSHSGTLFQGRFKNVVLETESQWLYLTKYIHRNPTTLQRTDPCNLSKYSHSSYPIYLGKRKEPWVDPSLILSQFPHNPSQKYKKFVEDDNDLGNIEHLTLDNKEVLL